MRKRFLALKSNEAIYVRSLEKRRKSHRISLPKAIAEEILRVITVSDVVSPSLPSLGKLATHDVLKTTHYEIQSIHSLNQNVGISLKPEKRTYIDFW